MGKMVNVIETPYIGSFKVESGKLRISDPCYDNDTWCAGTIDKVKNGKWDAFIVRSKENSWGIRVAELRAFHDYVCGPEGHSGVFNESPSHNSFRLHEHVLEAKKTFLDEIENEVKQAPDDSELKSKFEAARRSYESYREVVSDKKWQKTDIDVGVDSGQAGIFDLPKFMGRTDDDAGEKWYRECCDKTLAFPGAGVVDGGVVSSTGFGDGSYSCWVIKQHKEVVGVRIRFIYGD